MIFLVFALTAPHLVFGQINNSLQAGVAFTHTAILDEQASPLLYHHNGPAIDIRYQRNTARGIWVAQLNGGLGQLRPAGMDDRYWYITEGAEGAITDSVPLNGTFYHGQFKLGYLHAVQEGEQAQTFLGGTAGNTITYSDNITRLGWFNATSLNFEAQCRLSLASKHLLEIRVSIPILARITRLPWHNTVSAPGGNSNLHTLFSESMVGWPANYRQIDVQLQYQYQVREQLHLGIAYQAQWIYCNEHLPLNMLQQRGSVFTKFNF